MGFPPYKTTATESEILTTQGLNELYRHLRKRYSRRRALATAFWIYNGLQSAVSIGGGAYFIYYGRQGQAFMGDFLTREVDLSPEDSALLQQIADTIIEVEDQDLLGLLNEMMVEIADIERIEFLQKMKKHIEEDAATSHHH